MDATTARTNMYFGFSSQLGALGIQASIRALYIYQYNDAKNVEERLSTIEWNTIATIHLIRSGGAKQLRIRFFPGRLPENMIDLMLCKQQLIIQFAQAKEFIGQMVNLNLVKKINRYVNVHYLPNGLLWFIKQKIWGIEHERSGYYATEELFEANNPKNASPVKTRSQSQIRRTSRSRAFTNGVTALWRNSVRNLVDFMRN